MASQAHKRLLGLALSLKLPIRRRLAMRKAIQYSKDLERVGLTREQAETHLNILGEIIEGDVATKLDFNILNNEVSTSFSHFDVRFDEIEAQFAKVDARFDEMQAQFSKVDARFDDIDARFAKVDARFDEMQAQLSKVDARFDDIDARFAKVDARFDDIDARFSKVDVQFKELRSEMNSRFSEVGTEFKLIRQEMLQMEYRLIIKLGAITVGTTAFINGLFITFLRFVN